MNEHILTGNLARKLLDLDLVEVTHKNWTTHEPNLYIDGIIPIDGVYHSQELEVIAAVQLSFHEGVSDHGTVLVDITSRWLLGKEKFKIVRPSARRLITSNQNCTDRYIKYVEMELEWRCLHDKLCSISARLHADSSDTLALNELELIDK